jgi:hypothetical protein
VIAHHPVRRAALAGLLTLLSLPAAAHAADAPTGGVSPTAGAPAATLPAPVVPPTAPTSASAELSGAGTWTAAPSSVPGRPVRISGSFGVALARRTVVVERRGSSGRWVTAASTRVRSTGGFSVTWKTDATGVQELRVVLGKAASKAGSRAAGADAPSVTIAVVGRVRASWYGPGFYGNTTACGITLAAETVGVAHRTLPCGTQVELRLGGRSVVVPVIDRGPFANGASFDLTKPVADVLGLDGVGPLAFLRRDDIAPLKTPVSAPAMAG